MLRRSAAAERRARARDGGSRSLRLVLGPACIHERMRTHMRLWCACLYVRACARACQECMHDKPIVAST